MKNNNRLSQSNGYQQNLFCKVVLLFMVFTVLSCLTSACDSFTDVELPSSQLTAPAVFENKATANAAMVDIYSKIRDRGILTGRLSGISSQLGLYADELKSYAISGSGPANFYDNSLLPSGTEVAELWANSYNQIYAANAIIEGVEKSASLGSKDKNQLMGEALFVRALIHFHLLNVFGDVPYIVTTDYQQNRVVHRRSENEVYKLVETDLLKASILLSEDYIGTQRVRPNKWAAQALLSRVYLYTQQWDQAANIASSVLNQSNLYTWPVGLGSVFKKESLSTIWQLMPAMNVGNTHQGSIFIFVQGPPPTLAISDQLISAFSNEDLRMKNWIKAITDGTTIWHHAYKYKEKSNIGSSVEYSIVFRIAEQYLIRAEARAHQGDLIGAKEDLNKTRNLAGLENSTAIVATDLITAIVQERRLEFFTEFGHRFFDLKRTNKLDAVLSPIKPQWKTTNRLLPLPESDLLLNQNLAPQNEGY
jgi:hypothetical protein